MATLQSSNILNWAKDNASPKRAKSLKQTSKPFFGTLCTHVPLARSIDATERWLVKKPNSTEMFENHENVKDLIIRVPLNNQQMS